MKKKKHLHYTSINKHLTRIIVLPRLDRFSASALVRRLWEDIPRGWRPSAAAHDSTGGDQPCPACRGAMGGFRGEGPRQRPGRGTPGHLKWIRGTIRSLRNFNINKQYQPLAIMMIQQTFQKKTSTTMKPVQLSKTIKHPKVPSTTTFHLSIALGCGAKEVPQVPARRGAAQSAKKPLGSEAGVAWCNRSSWERRRRLVKRRMVKGKG